MDEQEPPFPLEPEPETFEQVVQRVPGFFARPDLGQLVHNTFGGALHLAPDTHNVRLRLLEVVSFYAAHEADALLQAAEWYDQHRQELILITMWTTEMQPDRFDDPDLVYEVALALIGCTEPN